MGTIAFLCLAAVPILLVGWLAQRHTDNVMEQQFLSQWDKSVKEPFTIDPAIIAKTLIWLVIIGAVAIAIGVALGV